MEVGGLSVEVEAEEYAEGGENRFKHRMPGPVAYSNLTMKQGMLSGTQAVKWFKDAEEEFQFEAHNMTVILLNEVHLPLQV